MRHAQIFIFLFALLLLASCKTQLHVIQAPVPSTKIDSTTQSDVDIEAMIAPYKEQLVEQMEGPIGKIGHELTKKKPESTLGNFAADVVLKKCRQYYGKPLDFAIMNYGGLRIPSIPEGDLSKGKVFELMPFENELVVMELDGFTLLQLFEKMAGKGGWPISKGVNYKIVEGKPDGIMILGQPLDLARKYTIGLSDYLANGGDGLNFLVNLPRTKLDVLYRDAIIEYVKELEGKPVTAKLEGRVRE